MLQGTQAVDDDAATEKRNPSRKSAPHPRNVRRSQTPDLSETKDVELAAFDALDGKPTSKAAAQRVAVSRAIVSKQRHERRRRRTSGNDADQKEGRRQQHHDRDNDRDRDEGGGGDDPSVAGDDATVTDDDIAVMDLCRILIETYCELDVRLSNRTRMSVSLFQTLSQAFRTPHTRPSFLAIVAAVHRILCALPPSTSLSSSFVTLNGGRSPSSSAARLASKRAATATECGAHSDLVTFLAAAFRSRGLLLERIQQGALVTDFSDLGAYDTPPLPPLSPPSASRTPRLRVYLYDHEAVFRIPRTVLYHLGLAAAVATGFLLCFVLRNIS